MAAARCRSRSGSTPPPQGFRRVTRSAGRCRGFGSSPRSLRRVTRGAGRCAGLVCVVGPRGLVGAHRGQDRGTLRAPPEPVPKPGAATHARDVDAGAGASPAWTTAGLELRCGETRPSYFIDKVARRRLTRQALTATGRCDAQLDKSVESDTFTALPRSGLQYRTEGLATFLAYDFHKTNQLTKDQIQCLRQIHHREKPRETRSARRRSRPRPPLALWKNMSTRKSCVVPRIS